MIFSELQETLIKNNSISQDYYEKHNVKRGLREKNGKGVMAGLTSISSVIGVKDGKPIEGELKYRGNSIFSIVEGLKKYDGFWFERIVFLILTGRYPSESELAHLLEFFSSRRYLSDEIIEHVIQGIPSKSVMNKIQLSIAALFARDPNPNSLVPYDNFMKALSIIAKLPAIVAFSYLSYNVENPSYVYPPEKLSIADSFLYMIREGGNYSPLEKELLDLCLVLHAEHGGGNNSTFTCKVVTSSGSDIYSALSAAVGSLKGPLHGSANEQVMDMMENIKKHIKDWDDKKEIAAYLKQILAKKAYNKSGKIYGLGHAVYTKSDPRAAILKEKAVALAKEKNREQELRLYQNIEELGPKIFKEVKKSNKVIGPNVDFYSGFVYECLNIPRKVYTPIFAMARAAGWSAHRIEEILSGKRIIRPGYKYVKNKNLPEYFEVED